MSRSWQALRGEYLLWTLAAGLAVLTAINPSAIERYPSLVDWPTIEALAGLLILTTGIEASGYLGQVANRIIDSVHSERQLALLLTLASALLSSVLTNDIALFIMVPLTISLGKRAELPVARLIIFEALAVNAGSTLTPIGNPQNLFLWHTSGKSFAAFVTAMAPLVALLITLLLALTLLSFRAKRLVLAHFDGHAPLDRKLLVVSLGLYVPFIAMLEMHRSALGVVLVLLIFLGTYRRVLAKVDWVLLIVFILMFIDLRLVADSNSVRALFEDFDLGDPRHLFLAGVASSQLMSNVPATILLERYTQDWATLAYAVAVGGFGVALGSLANIIAMRLARTRGIAWTFHLYSIPYLLVSGGLVYAWLHFTA